MEQRAGWIALGGVVCALAIAGLLRCSVAPASRFVTEPVQIGDLARTITTTGSVNPVATVQVGSYVSGPIQSIDCDFNTRVEAGQLCARIDARPYQAVVDQARADLVRAEAQLRKDEASLVYAKLNYERDLGLLETGVVSQNDLDLDRSAYDQAASQVELDRATIAQRQAALGAALLNLSYTNIVSPVSGTVVARNVDMGQTVAASFQTPTLFLIGKDLTQMQVDTNVSESDIGLAREGQRAVFSVEAYPRQSFEGKVSQVRHAPITVQNVVTYNVVIAVENADNRLFPGMTANARIIVEEHKGVKIVPARALRFDPDGVGAAEASDASGPCVFVLRDGEPISVPVSVGLDDGTRVEIVGDDLAVGDLVIVDVADGESAGPVPARPPLRF